MASLDTNALVRFLARDDAAQALEMLTSTDKFTMDETSAEAVSLYQLHHAEGVGFADCLILRASKRALPLYTFGLKFQRLKNVQPIT
jgi:predicted nucleic-acid-binding protein